MNKNKLAVVIPSFNRREVTENSVANLLSGTYSNVPIIICDSNSTDGTRDSFINQPSVSVINVGDHCWWTGAVNKGIEFVLKEGYEFVLLMNDDIDIDAHLIENLLDKARLNPGKIISPAQKTAQGLFLGINYVGVFKTPIISWVSDKGVQVDVQSSNGCCLLIPAIIFRKVGMFDEKRCPHLYGDTEFQVRAWNHGFSTITFPDIIINQHQNTNYFLKIKLYNLLTYKGSPVHFCAYFAFGLSLFQGWFRFIFFGVFHHLMYFRSLIKTLYVLCIKNT